MTHRDKEGRDVLVGRIEPAWQGHTDLGAQIIDTATLATKTDLALLRTDLAELKAELLKHTTRTLVWTSGINAATVTLILMLFRFLGGTP